MKKYFPILLSKAGEMIALNNLTETAKQEITPIIEILADNLFDKNGDYSESVEKKIISSWRFDDNQILLDFSLFDDLSSSIASVRRLFNVLIKSGVNVVPVVMFDSPAQYIKLVISLIATYNCNVCIRENNRSGGFLNYNAQIIDLLKSLNTNERNTLLLIDLGFAEKNTYNLLTTVAYQTILSINNPKRWKEIIVASGSFLPDLGSLTAPSTDRSPALIHRLQRFEWDIWKYLRMQTLPTAIKYGDFGTKHPYYLPAAFEGSASIKYTIENEYLIYRGKKASEHHRGGNQYNDSASRLISSADYLGRTFSWGDEEIYLIGSRNDRPGNAGNWVQISQNHHITILHSLL